MAQDSPEEVGMAAEQLSVPRSRSISPSPSITPSLALGACPELDRSVSDASTISSTLSSRSVSSVADVSHGTSKRRGYMRPQGTAFSASAKNRDSVMSLGSIAHMQYYFARTGLLDGKGAQLMKKSNTGERDGHQVRIVSGDSAPGAPLNDQSELNLEGDQASDEQEPIMLPPTVSTYRAKMITSQPPPDIKVLRRELVEALVKARTMIEELQQSSPASSAPPRTGTQSPDTADDGDAGLHELQGLNILDIITLAIRSAKDYYTFHPQPTSLYAIRSEREIRSDLYQALEILKKMANRNFRGGARVAELDGILGWIESIEVLLGKERQREEELARLREQWQWLHGDWTGKEHQREWQFLQTFSTEQDPLPAWEPASSEGCTDFLKALASGIKLVRLHNELVKQSSRRFGEIKEYYTDLGKPYRCADNLRYWIKAAELRWDIKLKVNVLDVVYDRGEDTWKEFDAAVLRWSQAVRTELSGEWLGHSTTISATETADAEQGHTSSAACPATDTANADQVAL